MAARFFLLERGEGISPTALGKPLESTRSVSRTFSSTDESEDVLDIEPDRVRVMGAVGAETGGEEAIAGSRAGAGVPFWVGVSGKLL